MLPLASRSTSLNVAPGFLMLIPGNTDVNVVDGEAAEAELVGAAVVQELCKVAGPMPLHAATGATILPGLPADATAEAV